MTSPDHRSGSDRIAEVAENLPAGSIIVNVQGDEPLIAPDTIDAAVYALKDDNAAEMSTTSEPIGDILELLNSNVVKVVVGNNGYAIYFSRSPVPFLRDAALRHGGDQDSAIIEEPDLIANFRKHTGLYVYRREYLLRFSKLPQTKLEQIEMLEQLRALEDGAKIRVVDAIGTSIGVDTQGDLERVRPILESPTLTVKNIN
jgi:3-deoxy-manno-octulosonate cytidylyltransferase (CMP-KDO synthetase)